MPRTWARLGRVKLVSCLVTVQSGTQSAIAIVLCDHKWPTMSCSKPVGPPRTEASYQLHALLKVPARSIGRDNYRDLRLDKFVSIRVAMRSLWEWTSVLIVCCLIEDVKFTVEWAQSPYNEGDPVRFKIVEGDHRLASVFLNQDEGFMPWDYEVPVMIFSMDMPATMRNTLAGRANNGHGMHVRETIIDKLCWAAKAIRAMVEDGVVSEQANITRDRLISS